MNFKIFAQNCIAFVQRYKLFHWLSLLLSTFFLCQTVWSCQQEQLLTKQRQETKQRLEDNTKKANLLKNKADQILAEINIVNNESKTCLVKKKHSQCETNLSKSLALRNELSLIIDEYKKLTDMVNKDVCFLYPDLNNTSCQKPVK